MSKIILFLREGVKSWISECLSAKSSRFHSFSIKLFFGHWYEDSCRIMVDWAYKKMLKSKIIQTK